MNDLQRCVELAQLITAQRQFVDDLETRLQTAKDELRRMETEDLPELMREIGVEGFDLPDGTNISVVDEVDCSITEERRAAAHMWLIEHGFSGLIKTEVVVPFGRGEHEAAQACAASIGGTMVEKVHPQTLKAFIKEQMQAAKTVPFDLFGIHPYSKIKMKKKRA